MKDFPRKILSTLRNGASKSVSDLLPVSEEQGNLSLTVSQCCSVELLFLQTNNKTQVLGPTYLVTSKRSYSPSELEFFLWESETGIKVSNTVLYLQGNMQEEELLLVGGDEVKGCIENCCKSVLSSSASSTNFHRG